MLEDDPLDESGGLVALGQKKTNKLLMNLSHKEKPMRKLRKPIGEVVVKKLGTGFRILKAIRVRFQCLNRHTALKTDRTHLLMALLGLVPWPEACME